jgi:phosphohistidine phosphatase
MLSPEGREKTQKAAEGLYSLGEIPGTILSSPLVRAVETAEIFRRVLRVEKSIVTSDLCAPGRPQETLIGHLQEYETGSLMVVGHMPDLATLASLLLSGTTTISVRFKKSSVMKLLFLRGIRKKGAVLHWLLQPKQMRRIGAKGKNHDVHEPKP